MSVFTYNQPFMYNYNKFLACFATGFFFHRGKGIFLHVESHENEQQSGEKSGVR